MKTPAEKYMDDPEYRRLVDVLEMYIHQARFTPSEIRKAAMYAVIRYEMRCLRPMIFIKEERSGSHGMIDRATIKSYLNAGKDIGYEDPRDSEQ